MLANILDSLNDPHARHAMLVHTPIVLGSLGVVPLIALAATKFRNVTLKVVCIAWFLVASGGAAMAINAGEAAEETVEGGLAPAAALALEKHEELAENGWLWPLIPAALVGLTFIRKRTAAVAAGALAIAAGAGVAGWVALTAHEGGRLVYKHGVGVPAPGDVQTAPPTPRRGHEDD